MSKEQRKQILISILIGACVAFFTSLFEGLLDVLKNNGNDIIGGISSTIYYITKQYRG